MSTPARRPYAARLSPEARREQLLDATLQVIARDGYTGVSIEAIAREANVTRPVVYSVYKNAGDLLNDLVDRQSLRVIADVRNSIPTSLGDYEDPDQFLIDGAQAITERLARDPLTWRPILLPPEGTPEKVNERIERGREELIKILQPLLAGVLEVRGGPKDFDLELLAHGLIGLAQQCGRLMLKDPERYTSERMVEFIQTALAAFDRGTGSAPLTAAAAPTS